MQSIVSIPDSQTTIFKNKCEHTSAYTVGLHVHCTYMHIAVQNKANEVSHTRGVY